MYISNKSNHGHLNATLRTSRFTNHGPLPAKTHYNIASRAAQSNSVYVTVLKIPIVHADSVSKLLRLKFFFLAQAAIVSAGGNNIFRDNNGYKQRLGPPVPKRRQFSDLFPWARVLKWGRKREKQRKRRLGISAVTIRFTIPPAMCQNNWFMLLAVHYPVMEHVGSMESTQEAGVALGYCLG